MDDRDDELLSHGTPGNAQANLVRAAKMPEWNGQAEPVGYRTRDWTMLYFFRILDGKERSTPPSAKAEGAEKFRTWLKALVAQHDAGQVAAKALLEGAGDLIPTMIEFDRVTGGAGLGLDRAASALQLYGTDTASYATLLAELNPAKHPDAPGLLRRMVIFELLRQLAPALVVAPQADGIHLSAVRCEANELLRDSKDEYVDRTPVNMFFTYSGLDTLQLDPATLASFPDAFKQGMAARSERLRDVGPNAPEHWEGELGLRTVHGYFAGSADLEQGVHAGESFWQRLRREIRTFNDPVDDPGRELRDDVNTLFAWFGIEVLHIELGQDPYRVERGRARPVHPRHEHFGFRDGLSQPDLDLGLDGGLHSGAPGDGTPSRRSTWTPVAAGEIFLDRNDETGRPHSVPRNARLRAGSTYLVFRKLEQDVTGFRAWLATKRGDKEGRRELAAQIVGRWPNGTSLVQSPDSELGTPEASLNDFRYAAEDPLGHKCPLGAHVRRGNPRDIGDRNNVQHHRILRRGMAYGGKLLGENDVDDGEKRGMLFVALNASIDTQFEVVQGAWINGGEFQGQAGLGRCPLTGTREGREGSSFLEAGSGVPLLGLPQFVTLRGGDYFFAPGIAALSGIADNCTFRPDHDDPYPRMCTADAAPVSPFGEKQLREIAGSILNGPKRVVRVGPRKGAVTLGKAPAPIAFVARHGDVTNVLRDDIDANNKMHFSVAPIREAGLRISRGDEWPIGTDEMGGGADARKRLLPVLNAGWKTLYDICPGGEAGVQRRLSQIVSDKLEAAFRRVAGTRTIDLIDDFAAPGAYGVVAELLGLPGPIWLTEMAMALPFANTHVGALPREWMTAARGETPTDPRLSTMQIWTCIMTADLIANAEHLTELRVLSRQAGSEMINHIDLELAKAGARLAQGGTPAAPPTLVDAFLANMSKPEIKKLYKRFGSSGATRYLRDVAMILLEIASATMAIIPFTFGQVMQLVIDQRRDSSKWQTAKDLDMAIYEAERLNPNIAFRVRRCEADYAIGDQAISKGDIVMALTGAAGRDEDVFKNPAEFSLGTLACPRHLDDYLLFGVPASKGAKPAQGEYSNKDCWGRDRVALPVLRECLRMAGRLRGLRRVAGPRGEPQKLAGVTIGLPARFTSLAPALQPAPPPVTRPYTKAPS